MCLTLLIIIKDHYPFYRNIPRRLWQQHDRVGGLPHVDGGGQGDPEGDAGGPLRAGGQQDEIEGGAQAVADKEDLK